MGDEEEPPPPKKKVFIQAVSGSLSRAHCGSSRAELAIDGQPLVKIDVSRIVAIHERKQPV